MNPQDFLDRFFLADPLRQVMPPDVIFKLEVGIVLDRCAGDVERWKDQALTEAWRYVKSLPHMAEDPFKGYLVLQDEDRSDVRGIDGGFQVEKGRIEQIQAARCAAAGAVRHGWSPLRRRYVQHCGGGCATYHEGVKCGVWTVIRRKSLGPMRPAA